LISNLKPTLAGFQAVI